MSRDLYPICSVLEWRAEYLDALEAQARSPL